MQNNKKTATIVIGVCTYNRPVMLSACLKSLAGQELTDNLNIIFCVANNNSDESYNIKDLVQKELAGHSSKYLFVEKRGISFARNAIVEEAINQNADFVAFIDDDEFASKNWITNLYNKINASGADAVQGKVIYKLPENVPPIIQDAWKFSCEEDVRLKHVGTNNVIFRKKLVEDWGLRFNDNLALTGGEDLDFFMKSGSKGGWHIFTNDAVVYETVPECRSTMRWQFLRKMRDGFAVSYVMYLNKGRMYVLRKYVLKSIKNIITSPFYILAGLVLSNEKLKFKGMQRFSQAIGCLAFAFNIKISGYKKVTGN